MKIGILTYHDTINYGAILQAYALQETIKQLGYDVIILDRHFNIRELDQYLGRKKICFKRKLLYYLKSILGDNIHALYNRGEKTKRFINQYLQVSDYNFISWEEIKNKQLNIDALIVGSDQVWRFMRNDIEQLKVFLLINAPNIPAISYAASIGMEEIPKNLVEIYEEGLKKFKSISVRESKSKELISLLGYSSVHVSDPTLLLNTEKWYDLLVNKPIKRKKQKRLLCYLMNDNIENLYEKLDDYSKKTNSLIDIFFDWHKHVNYEFPQNIKSIIKWLKWIKLYYFNSRISFHFNADPKEFLYYTSLATELLSNSFHALMFSIIFKINVRSIKPKRKELQGAFSRISEFEQYISSGNFICADIDSALLSFEKCEIVEFDYNKIKHFQETSKIWLKDKISNIFT